MTIILTTSLIDQLKAEADRLTEDAVRRLAHAEQSDCPDAWDAWKEADGISDGYAAALYAMEEKALKTAPEAEASTYVDWLAAYRPQPNPFRPHAPFDGMLFEAEGAELEHLRTTPAGRIWTLIAGDDDALYILSGCHLADRLGYFVTEHPWCGDHETEIRVG